MHLEVGYSEGIIGEPSVYPYEAYSNIPTAKPATRFGKVRATALGHFPFDERDCNFHLQRQ